MTKAWTSPHLDPDDMLIIVHADTRGEARALVASEADRPYVFTSVTRCQALDDLPITDATLLMTGLVGYVQCPGCETQIYPGSDQIADIDDNPDGKDASPFAICPFTGRVLLPHVVNGDVYCHRACYLRHLQFYQWLRDRDEARAAAS